MSQVKVTVTSPVDKNSFRVQQVAGMFDVTLDQKMGESFAVEVPAVEEDWLIGVIVGPSGSGKSTVAGAAFGKYLYRGGRWPKGKAVVDCFAESLEMKTITQMLTSVGFSSPPNWVRPYAVLSNGEKFRCDLARALLGERPVVAFDEFTSVVDRTVAKVGSAAVSKAIRRGHVKRKFVAITCHYDVVEWLEPDWVLDMASGKLARRRLRRPQFELSIYQASRASWELFKKTHYLNAGLSSAVRCYVGLIEGQPAAFAAVSSHFGKHKDTRQIRCISRIVVLPDFQGIGVGGRMLDTVAEQVAAEGHRVVITTGHPSMIALLKRAARWNVTRAKKTGHPPRTVSKASRDGYRVGQFRGSTGRAVISAEFSDVRT